MKKHSTKRRRWLIPAILTLFILIATPAMNLLFGDAGDWLASHQRLVWVLAGIGVIATIALAIWDHRQQDEAEVDVPQVVEEYEDLRKRYLKQIVEQTQFLTLRGLDIKSGDASVGDQDRLRLPDVYIQLDTTASVEIKDKRKRDKILFGRNTRPLSALEALIQNERMVLLGEPGSGKTTFVNYLAFCLASDGLNPRAGWLEKLDGWPKKWAGILPVPVVLRDLAAWMEGEERPEHKLALLDAWLQTWLDEMGLGDFHDTMMQMLRQGKAILFFDGLDEVRAEGDVGERVREMINATPTPFDSPILVTCRVLSYQDERWRLDEKRWPTFELARLNPEKIDHFIEAWYGQLQAMAVVTDGKTKAVKLQRAVRRPDLWRMARNPLLLTVMALVHSNKGELPDARALLYENVIDILLWRWDAVRLPRGDEEIDIRMLMKQADIQDVDLKRALWELAYNVHAQVQESGDGEATSDIPENLLIETLRTLAPDGSQTWTEAMLEIINLRAGLLVERIPGVYSFPHRTFQEYLAGCHLATLPDFTDVVVEAAREGAFWWQAILLAVGKLVHVNGDVDKPLVLVSELCPEQAPAMEDADGWRGCWLAGKALIEIGVRRAQRRGLGRDMTERLQERLKTLITKGLLAPRERADAGSVLSVLGDPRNFDEMVAVPAGGFLMGSNDYDQEKPPHNVFVEAFRISKYPVTNAQYAQFVQATNREPPKHWRGNTPPPELRNHPVVNISWHDAMAYCDWRQQETGLPYRLPTEAEWEKTARGTDGRIYPWGDDFSAEKCNVSETGIGGTSPVGLFPDGASPYGCLDMSGNVWEWTLSKYKPYPYNPDDGREEADGSDDSRVLRGGSFLDVLPGARCAFRFFNRPSYWHYGLGFRVVVPGL